MSARFVPLSVREGNRRKKFGWWIKGQREAVALRLAPWLDGRARLVEQLRSMEAECEGWRRNLDEAFVSEVRTAMRLGEVERELKECRERQ